MTTPKWTINTREQQDLCLVFVGVGVEMLLPK
jgi:hypothetical protein